MGESAVLGMKLSSIASGTRTLGFPVGGTEAISSLEVGRPFSLCLSASSLFENQNSQLPAMPAYS